MHSQLVVLVCVLTLCAGVSRPPVRSGCPDRICVCGDSNKSSTHPHQPVPQSIQAVCSDIPRQKLPSNIKALKIIGSVPTVTRNMIRILGGELLVLDLSDCGIHNIEPGSFDTAPKLHALKLSNNFLEEIGPAGFKGNKELRELYLDGNKLRKIESAFSKLDQLRELHLERNLLTAFPSKLPNSLEVLNISHNSIVSTMESDAHKTNLKVLDLCGNHVKELNFYALNKLEKLCIGDDTVTFPENTAKSLPHIASLSLEASVDQHAVLDSVTQTELHAMSTLTSLSIVHYTIDSLTFLYGLNKLRYLELKEILAPDNVEIQNSMLSQTSLNVLSLEGSESLAHALLYQMHVLGELKKLRKLNLRRTNLTNLPKMDIPETDDFQLDISENPLVCDCKFQWLLEKKPTKGGTHYLLNEDNTVCAEPQQLSGQRLVDALNSLDCSSVQEETTLTTDLDQTHLETDPPIFGEVGGGEEQPTTDNVGAPHTDMAGSNGNVNTEETPGLGPDTGDQGVTTAVDSDINIHESMPVSENSNEKTDRYSVLYIVLGCLLAILIIVGIVLALFYWHFKKTGSNKITPDPETTQTPVEQSFQQLQQTEESTLVKDVKKYSEE